MNEEYAKIINVNGYQVLVKKQTSKDGDYEFSSSIWQNENEYKNSYAYDDADDRDLAYADFDLGLAKQFVEAMQSLIKIMES